MAKVVPKSGREECPSSVVLVNVFVVGSGLEKTIHRNGDTGFTASSSPKQPSRRAGDMPPWDFKRENFIWLMNTHFLFYRN